MQKKSHVSSARISLRQKIFLSLFGIFLAFVLLETGMRIGALTLIAQQEKRNRASAMAKDVYRILCVGESTTQGQYPAVLEQVLNESDIFAAFSVIDRGLISTNTTFIVNNIERYIHEYAPDAVVAMMGINDLGLRMPLEKPTSSKIILFFRNLKTYKLLSLLRMHIIAKAKGQHQNKSQEGKDAPQKNSQQFFTKDLTDKYVGQNTAQPEKTPKQALTPDSGNEKTYVESGWFYKNQNKPEQAEESFKKALEIDPGNEFAYFELACIYRRQKRDAEAEEMFEKSSNNPVQIEAYLKNAIKLDPKNDTTCVELGWLYKNQNQMNRAEEFFKKASEINPGNEFACFELARIYREQKRFSESEELFKTALAKDPRNGSFMLEFSWLLLRAGKFQQAAESYERTLEIDPNLENACLELGELYRKQGKLLEAEELFKRVLKIYPTDGTAYLRLGWLYTNQARFKEAENIFNKALELSSDHKSKFYGALANMCVVTGQLQKAARYYRLADDAILRENNSLTTHNYQRLKEILDKRNIKLICVQYPMLSIVPLKKIFSGQKDIIFVDNEKIFKDAVRQEGYDAYFIDLSAGEFGHCTPKGNTLLAQNIAEAILKNIFDQRTTSSSLRVGKENSQISMQSWRE